MLQKLHSKLELTGSFVAIACAIHCISIPILLSLGSIGAFHWMEHSVLEMGFLFTSLTIASWSLITSYRKHMVNSTPIILFAIGFVALSASIWLHLHSLSAVGGVLIATAHFFNWRQLNKKGTCEIPATQA